MVLGHVVGDAEACNAATWWERTLTRRLGPSEAWLPDLRGQFAELFGPEARVRIERFSPPPDTSGAEALAGHASGDLERIGTGLICRGLLDAVDERLARDWCIHADPGCDLSTLADELDALLRESDGPGGALLLARLKAPLDPSGASG